VPPSEIMKTGITLYLCYDKAWIALTA